MKLARHFNHRWKQTACSSQDTLAYIKVYNTRPVSLTIEVLLVNFVLFIDHWSNHLFQSSQPFQAIEFFDWRVPEKLDIFRSFLFYWHEMLQLECVTVKYKATRIHAFNKSGRHLEFLIYDVIRGKTSAAVFAFWLAWQYHVRKSSGREAKSGHYELLYSILFLYKRILFPG